MYVRREKGRSPYLVIYLLVTVRTAGTVSANRHIGMLCCNGVSVITELNPYYLAQSESEATREASISAS